MSWQPPAGDDEQPPEVGGGAPRPHPPDGTTELGIDIIKVGRIKATLNRFGPRFSNRVLTPGERRYVNSRGFMFVGRGATYPAALEGALKLKEISYVHAEGYPAGELKHGPISLLDAECPLVAVATRSS
ncbi:MAG TPA: SIS domain-containing protein, partial [Candidatus Limnocylindrales bacterium]|nr:SIS domain-containing protein [Candidatus Limnocylindrales bacterium]